MTYKKDTKINTIPNAKNILQDTIQTVQNIFDTYSIGDFINIAKETAEESIATTTLGIFFGCGTGAAANVPKKFKGDLPEKIGQALATWRKNGKDADKITSAVNNTKLEMAKNMLLAKMDVKQIATITGLSEDEINALNA